MKAWLDGVSGGIFWFWNFSFLLFCYAVFLPLVGVFLIMAVAEGQIELPFLLTMVGLMSLPVICTIFGVRFYKDPSRLIRLFYGVETPLFVLCLLRLFVLRELTDASFFLLGTVILCIVVFAIELIWGYAENNKILAYLQLLAHSLILLVGVYLSAILLFYVIPAGVSFLKWFLSFVWLENFFHELSYNFALSNFLGLLIVLTFFILSSTLFLLMPPMLGWFYISAGTRIIKAFKLQYGQHQTLLGCLGIITAWLVLFVNLSHQPQILAFKLLGQPVVSQGQRQTLLDRSDEIRWGLVNAYLSNYRYLSSVKDNNHIANLYRNPVGLSENMSQQIQGIYNLLLSPFLYQGSREDVKLAENLYEEFFDIPIQKAERVAIQHAVQSTANREEVKAGLLNLNEKKVWLKSQSVKVKDEGSWGEIELYEQYVNQTREVQEVYYSFTLPESAVITGIWLGDTPDLTKRFKFQVSPRGAAQKVYNSQVRRERPIDPALLEQVGPRHYRLRAFPIPVTRPNASVKEMNLWLTYKVMRQPEGWPLPRLAEKRNIYWSNYSERSYQGGDIKNESDWLPLFLTPESQGEEVKILKSVINGYEVTARKLAESDYVFPVGKQLAVVLDNSRSMENKRAELSKMLNWLQQQKGNDFDLYVTDAISNGALRFEEVSGFNLKDRTFYGSLSLQEMLNQFLTLRGGKVYDGILLVTDEGSYELSKDRLLVADKFSAPLWMIHLGSFPPAYDDGTLKLIQDSQGGVNDSLYEVLRSLATRAKLNVWSVIDGYAIEVNPTDRLESSGGFNSFAARFLVQFLSRGSGSLLSELDQIHAIAKSYNIVTPYSSMIVLVNDEQRRMLAQAEASSDRFSRKVESGKEDLTNPNSPLDTSIPEPSLVISLLVFSGIWLVGMRAKIIR